MSAGRPLDPSRDAAILDAALALVAEVGYLGLTVDALAARAGTSKATIYRRWTNKHQVVVAAVGRYRAQQRSWSVDTGSLRDDLLAHAGRFVDSLSGYDGRLAIGLIQARSAHPELLDELEVRFTSGARLPPEVIDRAVRRGELARPVEHGFFEEVVASMIFMRWLGSQPLDGAYLEHLVDSVALPLLGDAASRSEQV